MSTVLRNGPGIILLNGPSSAGKSTIAARLSELMRDAGVPSAVVSIDDHMKLAPGERVWEDDVFEIMPGMCAAVEAALARGDTVIVDHVITSARIYELLRAAAAGRDMFTVLVHCSPAILREREAARGDRHIGSAEESARYLYPKDGYDLSVDSGVLTPGEAADQIARKALGAAHSR